MNDSSLTVLRIPRTFPVRVLAGALIAMVLWGAVLGLEFTQIRWLAMVASLFTVISLRHIRRPATLRLEGDGILIEKTAAANPDKSESAGVGDIYRTPESWQGQRILIEDVETLLTVPRNLGVTGVPPDRHAAVIIHRQGDIFLPRGMPGRSKWLTALRQKMLALDPLRLLSADLSNYHKQESGKFGPDAIFTARVLSRFSGGRGAWRGGFLDLMLALLGAGILSAILAPDGLPGKTDRGAAPFLAGIGGIFLFFIGLFWLTRRSTAKNLSGSGIVISPAGLALHYGQLKGVLGWEELKSCHYRKAGSAAILRLDVPGSNILLADFFDRPLSEVHQTLLTHSSRLRR